jgi:hypothetical protein
LFHLFIWMIFLHVCSTTLSTKADDTQKLWIGKYLKKKTWADDIICRCFHRNYEVWMWKYLKKVCSIYLHESERYLFVCFKLYCQVKQTILSKIKKLHWKSMSWSGLSTLHSNHADSCR